MLGPSIWQVSGRRWLLIWWFVQCTCSNVYSSRHTCVYPPDHHAHWPLCDHLTVSWACHQLLVEVGIKLSDLSRNCPAVPFTLPECHNCALNLTVPIAVRASSLSWHWSMTLTMAHITSIQSFSTGDIFIQQWFSPFPKLSNQGTQSPGSGRMLVPVRPPVAARCHHANTAIGQAIIHPTFNNNNK